MKHIWTCLSINIVLSKVSTFFWVINKGDDENPDVYPTNPDEHDDCELMVFTDGIVGSLDECWHSAVILERDDAADFIEALMDYLAARG